MSDLAFYQTGLLHLPSLIIGEGEMAEMIRAFDWARSPLGEVETWPDTLLTTVNLLLASRHPMFLFWGPEFIQFYNDSYRPSIRADKHLTAIGQRGPECWPEIWPIIGPQLETVMQGGATFHSNQLVPINRNGRLEEVFWTYSYSPVRDKAGLVQGTLVVCTDTTEQVLNERRLRTLLAISADTSAQDQLPPRQPMLNLIQNIAKHLSNNTADFPFAALYLLDQGKVLQAGSTASKGSSAEPGDWPIADLLKTRTPLLVEDLQQRFGDLVCEPWPEPVTRACLFPLSLAELSVRAVLVFGISPRLPFDQSYRVFLELVAIRISGLLENAAHLLDRVERTRQLELQAVRHAEKVALLDLTQDSIVVRDMSGTITYWNRSAAVMNGWSAHEALGRNIYELLGLEFSESAESIHAKLLHSGRWEGESQSHKRDGTRLIVSTRWALQRDAAGAPFRILSISSDITDRKLSEEALRHSDEKLRILVQAVKDYAIFMLDPDGRITTWNEGAERISGYPVGEILGQHFSVFYTPEARAEGLPTLALKMATEQGSFTEQGWRLRKDGSRFWADVTLTALRDELGHLRGFGKVTRDVTERMEADRALRNSQAQMAHLAEHDFLTGLPNRMLLTDRVNQSIAQAPRHLKRVAVLFLDLDGFKYINDSLGHPMGDKLLQSVANRLAGCVRDSDTVSRQGGDEFVVLLSEVKHADDTAITARRMLQAVAQTHSVAGRDLHITASIGVSVYPDDGMDADTLIKNADVAMYHAKENGRGSFQFFKPAMNVQAVERQSTEEALRRALDRGEFSLHYQPKVNVHSGEITGAEALIRWDHPTRGSLPPAQFIPVAEACGLIIPIGKWVLREACTQARAWVDAGLPPASIAVNISAIEFRQENFLQGVFNVLDETGLPPSLLQLELTESVMMKHVESTEAIFKALRARGVQLAVDDFGTGYSSLSYLRRFPIDILKIDRSFVRQIATGPQEAAIVTTIISMGQSLKLRVVAEGVETREELTFLRDQNCDESQGYYFSRPVPLDEFIALLKAGIPRASIVVDRRTFSLPHDENKLPA
jgi:diguanylate cyclase (GGDEF)-like protein/PAS domain S-box-containing protein